MNRHIGSQTFGGVQEQDVRAAHRSVPQVLHGVSRQPGVHEGRVEEGDQSIRIFGDKALTNRGRQSN